METRRHQVAELPDALAGQDELHRRLAGKRPALFCDYDGTLTPIVDRPEDAVISPAMREAVRRLAERIPVCVVSGRDRRVVQKLMGVDDLVVAGSHGFDIWSPSGGAIQREEGAEYAGLLGEVRERLSSDLAGVPGALVEPKRVSVAAHYRLVPEAERPRVRATVEELVAEHPKELRVTPGKLVLEVQPRIEWDKGRAVTYLLGALDLDCEDVVPIYLGDDVTDEDAFAALAGRGVGVFVGRAGDPELGGRGTAADYALSGPADVERFFDLLTAWTTRAGVVQPGALAAEMGGWTLAYDGFDPKRERLREVLTSTGNGYFCSRGAAEWADVDEVHYPGTYSHGCYNRETTLLGGRPVLNEDLVNLPNWLILKLQAEGGDPVSLDGVELCGYRHHLDVRTATVSRSLRFRDPAGRESTLVSRRFVSMADMHLGALEWTLTAENWSGEVTVITALDGRVTNQGVERYRELEGRHLHPMGSNAPRPDTISLIARTRQTRITVAEAARTRVFGAEAKTDCYEMEDYVHQALSFQVEQGRPVRVEKLVALYTSRDRAINEPRVNAEQAVAGYGTWAECFEAHARAWEELWARCEVALPHDDRVQFLLRLHTSHLLQTCSPHTVGLDAGLPARGLNGEAYRGHVFWDELYAYPFYNFRLPAVTRELLMYRYRRLGMARALAREAGFRGAMYPWQSGSDGKEETQVVHLNPRSGRWEPDLSRQQRHVNAAIFYNIWHYFQATGDNDFLLEHGAEMMLEIARFWASAAHFNPARERYEIHGVMGPDEFHERYPGSEEAGLRNNAYTNVMVAWLTDVAAGLPDLLPERLWSRLRTRIGLGDDEIETWREMSRRMFVPFLGDGILSQFEGYENLEELDWDAYRKRYGNIQRLDRILRAAGDDPDRYKMAKQADTVLLFFLFREDHLREILERLGYRCPPDMVRRNLEYYDRRTSHGSTLSFVAHAGVLAEIDPAASWERYLVALESDVGDVQGGTTAEGIHVGVMAGTLDLMQRSYLGERVRDGTLVFQPAPVKQLEELSLPLRFKGTQLDLTLEAGSLRVAAWPGRLNQPLKVRVQDDVRELRPGENHIFKR
ncbi:MAG: trehalose-phosphatase [Candidatus Dormibacteraeota bacterium]|nr:trehalose-phosphatase [Candidatus Dormibacteraeota bacterium]